jgi:ATP-binding cassette subfamily F protein 3
MNLLILDEPTNHLDLHSKDILLDTLRRFKGTIIFVSHDRAFMEALSTRTLELAPNDDISAPARARLFYGSYAYYLERVEREALEQNQEGGSTPPSSSPASGGSSTTPSNGAPPRNAPSEPCGAESAASGLGTALPSGRTLPAVILVKAGESRPLTAGEKRDQDKQKQTLIRRLERQEGEILKTLEDLENEKTRLEAELARPEVYSNGEKAKAVKLRLDNHTAAIEAKTAEWETLAAELEAARAG